MPRGGARGGLGGATAPRQRHLAPPPPPSEEILDSRRRKFGKNNARKHHFSVILAPCRKLQPLYRKISGATPEHAPDPLDGCAFGVPFENCFAKGPPMFSSCLGHRDERHNSSDRPPTIIYASKKQRLS